jgi:hypothetical protein
MLLLPNNNAASDDDDAISADQARQNRTTRNQWQLYASHRRNLERLIVPDSPRRGRICVLGAGNCNDLDLKWLCEVYREVHFVDLDSAALESAVDRQGVGKQAAIHRHAPFDLTGIADIASRWTRVSPPTPQQLDTAIQKLTEPPRSPWGRFETVLSPCVLTQLINPIRDALRDHGLPPSHPVRLAIRKALRQCHLRMLAACTAPAGGKAVLAVDLICSKRHCDLARVPEDRLDSFMHTSVSNGGHYSGLDPAALTAAWRFDPVLSREFAEPRFSAPWLWHLGLRKSFLVYAATFRRRGSGLISSHGVLRQY